MLIFAKMDPKIRNATSEKYTLNFGTSPYHHIGEFLPRVFVISPFVMSTTKRRGRQNMGMAIRMMS